MNSDHDNVEHSAEEILSNTAFETARDLYIRECVRVYEYGVFPGGFGADVGRVTALAIMVCLHAHYVESDRATWPTLQNLKTTVANFGFASPRLLDDFVARLVQRQFLELRPHPMDQRVRLLVPTEALLAWDREWMAAHFEPLAILFPNPGYALGVDRCPAFQKAHGSASVPVLDGAIKVAWRNLDLVYFLNATSALSILLTIHHLGITRDDQQISMSEILSLHPQFGVSRSHTRNVLLAAEQRGFLARHGQKGRMIALTARWVSAFDPFMADSLSYSSLTYRLGLKALRETCLPAVSPDPR